MYQFYCRLSFSRIPALLSLSGGCLLLPPGYASIPVLLSSFKWLLLCIVCILEHLFLTYGHRINCLLVEVNYVALPYTGRDRIDRFFERSPAMERRATAVLDNRLIWKKNENDYAVFHLQKCTFKRELYRMPTFFAMHEIYLR